MLWSPDIGMVLSVNSSSYFFFFLSLSSLSFLQTVELKRKVSKCILACDQRFDHFLLQWNVSKTNTSSSGHSIKRKKIFPNFLLFWLNSIKGILYKADTSLEQTPFFNSNGVRFRETRLYLYC